MKVLMLTWNFLVYLESQVILALYASFTKWICAGVFENVILTAHAQYRVGMISDYVFMQD